MRLLLRIFAVLIACVIHAKHTMPHSQVETDVGLIDP